MIHLNPYYILSHVIYINVDRRFIHIEKDVYLTIHSLIFQGRMSSAQQRRRLRELLYDTYYAYMYLHEQIDLSKFNEKLFDIYNRRDSKFFDHSTIIEKEEVRDAHLTDNVFFEEEDKFQDIEESENIPLPSDLQQTIIRYKQLDNDEVDIMTTFNLYLFKNKILKDLVDYLGFGKCRNLVLSFIHKNEYNIKDTMEFFFYRNIVFFLSKYRLKMLNKKYDFICECCSSIGKHYIRYKKGIKHDIESQHCYQVHWFHYGGYVPATTSALNHSEYNFDDVNTFNKDIILSYHNHFRVGIYQLDCNSQIDIIDALKATKRKVIWYKNDLQIDGTRSMALRFAGNTIMDDYDYVSDKITNLFDPLWERYFERYLYITNLINSHQMIVQSKPRLPSLDNKFGFPF